MKSRAPRHEHDVAIDWMAELVSEEPSASDAGGQPSPLIDVAPQPESGEELRPTRLIPRPPSSTPSVASPLPPLQRWGPAESNLSPLEIVGVSMAMVAIVAAFVGAALLWDSTAQVVDARVALTPAPAQPLVEPAAAVVPPSTPPGATEEARRSPETGVSLEPRVPVTPQRTVQDGPGVKSGTSARSGAGAQSGAGAVPDVRGVTAAAPTPTRTPEPAAAPPPPPASLSVGPPVAMFGAPLPARPGTDPAAPPAATERAVKTAAIRAVLDRYRAAFNTLSVEGLGTFWRSVDTKALARAFDQLEKQTVEFDACRIEIDGDLAEASCQGRTSFVPKIGARSPRVESRRWEFRLVQVRGGWVIDHVELR